MDSLIWPSRIVVPMIPGDFRYLPNDELFWCNQVLFIARWCSYLNSVGHVIDMDLRVHRDHNETSLLDYAASWSFIQSGNWK